MIPPFPMSPPAILPPPTTTTMMSLLILQVKLPSFTFVCVTQAIWLKNILAKIHFPQQEPTTTDSDNGSTIKLSKNPVLYRRSEHINVNFHFQGEDNWCCLLQKWGAGCRYHYQAPRSCCIYKAYVCSRRL